MISRFGERRIFHMPSSRLSFCAAKSKRATCAADGFSSSLIGMVFSGGAAKVVMIAPNRMQCGMWWYATPAPANRAGHAAWEVQIANEKYRQQHGINARARHWPAGSGNLRRFVGDSSFALFAKG